MKQKYGSRNPHRQKGADSCRRISLFILIQLAFTHSPSLLQGSGNSLRILAAGLGQIRAAASASADQGRNFADEIAGMSIEDALAYTNRLLGLSDETYAEYMELAKTITVPDERELFYEIFNWALDFERRFDQSGDYQSEIESQGPRWLLESFPYRPEQNEEVHLSMGGI